MALLFASASNGPYEVVAGTPFIDYDPLGVFPFDPSGATTAAFRFPHQWGLWNEGFASSADKDNPWSGIASYSTPAASSQMNVTRPEYPAQIKDDRCDWGLKNTLIAGISISDREQEISTGQSCEFPVLVFRDKAQGDQIGVWLLVDPDPGTPGGAAVSIRWRLEVRRGATILFTSGNVLPYGIGSAEAGLDDLPLEYNSRLYTSDTAGAAGWGQLIEAAGILFIEFKAVIDPVAGSYELKVDGLTINSDAGPINTAEQGTAGADQLKWSYGGNTAGVKLSLWASEIYLADNSTADLNNFLGRIQVHQKAVNAQGFQSEWTPDSGVLDHSDYVGTLSDISDTSYLESNTATDTELFTFSDFPRNMSETLLALRVVLRGALSVGGDRTASPVFRTGGVSYIDPGTTIFSGPAFESRPFNIVENPDTLAPWTKSSLNGQELGFTLIS